MAVDLVVACRACCRNARAPRRHRRHRTDAPGGRRRHAGRCACSGRRCPARYAPLSPSTASCAWTCPAARATGSGCRPRAASVTLRIASSGVSTGCRACGGATVLAEHCAAGRSMTTDAGRAIPTAHLGSARREVRSTPDSQSGTEPSTANAWIKQLRHAHVDGVPFRDRFICAAIRCGGSPSSTCTSGASSRVPGPDALASARRASVDSSLGHCVRRPHRIVASASPGGRRAARKIPVEVRGPARRATTVARVAQGAVPHLDGVGRSPAARGPAASRRRWCRRLRAQRVLARRRGEESYIGPVLGEIDRASRRRTLSAGGRWTTDEFPRRELVRSCREFADPAARDLPLTPVEAFARLARSLARSRKVVAGRRATRDALLARHARPAHDVEARDRPVAAGRTELGRHRRRCSCRGPRARWTKPAPRSIALAARRRRHLRGSRRLGTRARCSRRAGAVSRSVGAAARLHLPSLAELPARSRRDAAARRTPPIAASRCRTRTLLFDRLRGEHLAREDTFRRHRSSSPAMRGSTSSSRGAGG